MQTSNFLRISCCKDSDPTWGNKLSFIPSSTVPVVDKSQDHYVILQVEALFVAHGQQCSPCSRRSSKKWCMSCLDGESASVHHWNLLIAGVWRKRSRSEVGCVPLLSLCSSDVMPVRCQLQMFGHSKQKEQEWPWRHFGL